MKYIETGAHFLTCTEFLKISQAGEAGRLGVRNK